MKKLWRVLRVLLRAVYRSGVLLRTIPRITRFVRQWKMYVRSSSENVSITDWFPQLGDETEKTPFDPHYFYQSAWAAKSIARHAPSRHTDVGSQIDFVGPLAGFMDVEFVDIRPLEALIEGLTCRSGSILGLPYPSDSLQSLSSLHVIEHIGLGRYGDTIDPRGSIKACKELQRVLAKGGHLYLSTPVGRERVEFNAHRVHAAETIAALFEQCELTEFAMVDDGGTFRPEATLDECRTMSYACGMFHFVKRR